MGIRSLLIVTTSLAALVFASPALASPPGGGGSSSSSSSSSGGGSHGGGGGGSSSSGGGHSGGGSGGGHSTPAGGHASGAFGALHGGPSGDGAHGGGAGAVGSVVRGVTAPAPDRPTALTAWMGSSNNSGARNHLAAVWRARNAGLDRNAPWKRGGDWWKGRPGFRDYHGHHRHHLFIPDIGYVETSVDDCPFDSLQIGDLTPACAMLYVVSDWASYGLPAPPGGCEWVWLDGDIALVQISDGYIVDIVRQVF